MPCGIAFDGVDECSSKAFEREGTSHFQRLSGGDVPFDIGVGILAEMQRGPARASRDMPGGEVDQAMAVHNSPVAPRMARSRSRATSALCGLP